MSNYVATDVYALFKKSIKKNLLCNVQNEGGGVNGFLNNVKKKLRIWGMKAPLIYLRVVLSILSSSIGDLNPVTGSITQGTFNFDTKRSLSAETFAQSYEETWL